MTATTTKEESMTTGQQIEQSSSTHFCLKRAWAEFKTKDPVDAYHNALTLLKACKERMDGAANPSRY